MTWSLISDGRCGSTRPVAGSSCGPWVDRWFPVQDLDPRTVDNYESYLRCHVLVRFGATPLGEITALDVDAWVKESREAGYAPATVASWVKAAVDDLE